MKTKTMKRIGALILALSMCLGLLAGCGKSLPTMNDEFGNSAIGVNGAVTSASELASQAGLDILKAGGNAIDAAVATAFALGVTEPMMSGIGGCGMMNIFLEETGEYEIIEYMETCPINLMPGTFDSIHKSTARAAAVPGQVAGLLTALEKYGTMSREQVMAPAIKLARDGFEVSKRLASSINSYYDQMGEEAMAIYTNGGIPYNQGEILVNKPLADTLQAISDGGMDAFYKGELAEKMVEGLQANGSEMCLEDLTAYQPAEREPITTTYYGYEVVTVPPPSMGGDWLLEMLNIMEEKNIAQYKVNSPEYLYVLNEAIRISYKDAKSYIGDPAYYELPVKELISKEFAAERAKLIDTSDLTKLQAIEEIPDTDLPYKKLETTGEEGKDTTHFSVVDGKGNMVSSTNTLGTTWGCKFYAPGLGFFYNSHVANMDHENPESPDYVMPGKRVRSTISPTLVVKDGQPVLAIGSPGSSVIPPAIACVINNLLVYDMELQDAINLTRPVTIVGSRQVYVERDLIDPTLEETLTNMGYVIKYPSGSAAHSSAMGCVNAIYKKDGVLFAGADPRRQAKAFAY